MRKLGKKIHIALVLCTEVEKANWAKGSLVEASYGKSCPTKNLSYWLCLYHFILMICEDHL